MNFKPLLKLIFPRLFLKRAFLVYNTMKAATWDRLFFRLQKLDERDYLLYRKTNPFRDLSIDTEKFDHRIKKKLAIWEDPQWFQEEYILDYKYPGLIEPRVGWALAPGNKLIGPSLGLGAAPHVRRPSFSETYLRRPKISALKKVISLRDSGEENYFHFYNDIITKIFHLERHGIATDEYTFVVSARLFNKEYFQRFITKANIPPSRFYVQQNEWISFERAIFCKPMTHDKGLLKKIFELMSGHTAPLEERKIFLTRDRQTFRYIENMKQLTPILIDHGFNIVDTTGLSVADQISLFSKCRYLIGIHGAGLTNLAYRGSAPLSVLEILQPSPYLPFHYIMLAKMFGFGYDAIEGRVGKEYNDGGFYLDPEILDTKIRQMLTNRDT